MKMRTSKPSNNRYYTRIADGGYNGAIQGKPTDSTANVLSNCVGYANGRFNEIIGEGKCKYQLICNAENFIERAKELGLKISKVPVVGGVMVWQRGATLSNKDGAGHVAIVEKIIDDNTIYTSESAWGGKAFYNATRSNSNGRWGIGSAYKFRGCIINPAVKSDTTNTSDVIVDGKWGKNTTRMSQKVMKTTIDGIVSGQLTSTKKYLPAVSDTSWKFSKNGKGSLLIKAIQKMVGAKVDGYCGVNTVKAMQRFLKALGFYTGSIDGIMGSNTVKGWQRYLNNKQ